MPKDTKTLCIKKGCASVLTQPLFLYTSTQNKASAPGWLAAEPIKRTSSNVY